MKPNDMQQAKEWKHYTVGFCFSPRLEKVVLIRKAKPEWQKGKLNGVGGSFEQGETMFQCMEREFQEETTLHQRNWKHFGTGWYDCHQGACAVHYLAVVRENIDMIPTMEIEQPDWYWVSDVEKLPIIGNLFWLIPMARLKLLHPEWAETGTVELNFK